jgi:excisionase family DNA binding protein
MKHALNRDKFKSHTRQSADYAVGSSLPSWAQITVPPKRLSVGKITEGLASPQSSEEHGPQSQSLLSVNDVAAQLGVSTKTIRRIIARQELPFLRIGRLIRIRQTDLLSYLKISHISLFLLCFIFYRDYFIC